MTDWSKYPNFSEHEFRCSHTGQCDMQDSFLERLQLLRDAFARPMIISSGYRHPTHPVERGKTSTGTHSMGRAADIRVSHKYAYNLIYLAIGHGFTGIGVQQKGNARFIHLDDVIASEKQPRPTVWSY